MISVGRSSFFQSASEVVERRPLALVVLHGVGGADVGMLGEIFDELGESRRILLLEARARRMVMRPLAYLAMPLADALRRHSGILLEPLVAVASGARADAGQRERQRAVGVEPAECAVAKAPCDRPTTCAGQSSDGRACAARRRPRASGRTSNRLPHVGAG